MCCAIRKKLKDLIVIWRFKSCVVYAKIDTSAVDLIKVKQ